MAEVSWCMKQNYMLPGADTWRIDCNVEGSHSLDVGIGWHFGDEKRARERLG